MIIQATLEYDVADFHWSAAAAADILARYFHWSAAAADILAPYFHWSAAAADILARYFLAVLFTTIWLPNFKYGTSISETPVHLYKVELRLIAKYSNFQP